MTPHDELMALAGKLPKETWVLADDGYSVVTDDQPIHRGHVASVVEPDDAAFIAAACNFVRSDAFRAMVRDVWLPIEVGGKLPAIGEWALVLTDRSALGRADLNFLYPDRPRFAVVPAQLRAINDGWPLWQRWELASGHPVAVLEGDTHWRPLPAPPQAIDAAASGAGESDE